MTSDAHILAVDDSASNLLLVKRILQSAGYTRVKTVSRSSDVVAYFDAHPPDLLLLDLHMPDPDGFELLRLLTPWTTGEAHIPVLVLTADVSHDTRHRALDGGARDFLTKPLDHIDVLLRIRNVLYTRELQLALQAHNQLLNTTVAERTHELDQARLEAFETLALAAEYRDDETREHTRRIGHAARLLALELGLDASVADVLAQVAPLHDVGKIAIPDAILLKPEALDEPELTAMKEHAAIGAQIMRATNSPLFTLASEIALSHHERWDGSGYPNGLAGTQIPLNARIVAVVDAFDAISHERPYKPAWPLETSLAEIKRCSRSHFDPAVVDAFLRLDHPTLLHLPVTATSQPAGSTTNARHQIEDDQAATTPAGTRTQRFQQRAPQPTTLGRSTRR
ncbi:MAG: response regulator [Actinobacteria bacterium]|nr:response regulator [Actinomycetota bacterium]